MEYITLQNGVQMPILGFGTCRILEEKGKQVIINALQTGYRLLDTAIMYRNETIVGTAIKKVVFLGVKFLSQPNLMVVVIVMRKQNKAFFLLYKSYKQIM